MFKNWFFLCHSNMRHSETEKQSMLKKHDISPNGDGRTKELQKICLGRT